MKAEQSKRKGARRRLRNRNSHGRPSIRKRTRERSYEEGYERGYNEGVQLGRLGYGTKFHGTSIIIPTYNQLEYLKACIDSIRIHTPTPYEIIVVDNASTDGTEQYLQRLGGEVRYRVHDRNLGFAGAINTGLMMAKGTTIALLNNDVIATRNWLANMLSCLHSDPGIGMVGPVTNYIGGDQQIEVPYRNLEEMHAFAEGHNRPDRTKWQRTDRLVGFCLLFRRELFEQAGYLDEGYEMGNFEDDDYVIRVRLLGYSLMTARDTFVHHFGSVSMKALGDGLQTVNDRNSAFFSQKWANPYALVDEVKQIVAAMTVPLPPARTSVHFYPSHVLVKGSGETIYWIEDGMRHPVEGHIPLPVTRVSQIELRGWELGDAIGGEAVMRRYRGGERGHAAVAEAPVNGQLLAGSDGTLYQYIGQQKRKIVSEHAAAVWNLHLKNRMPLSEERLREMPEGLPIVSAPLIKGMYI
ncbi:glycosyltransferase family 2 protein [Paenibacillus sp. CECT 9249]|uniref:glycosyltransferase family 2 protein n=1 Tax=unclassified Paenibacillus TaxID=185978 RepID=UPI001E43669F|nr:glycosyltransferase family 2 protein [Paenibacillus sp. CECT 9249]CAH0118461.1 hypothetical protein PAE9249_00950 [Paenibacillus sp. CECT 9249]